MATCHGYYSQRRAASPTPRSVPTWEQRFCWEVGRVPWKRVLNSKKYIRHSHKVMCWNDSAGEEAFNAAKRRYWAKIKGLPCKIRLPSPDKYIDQVKWSVPNSSSSSSSSSNVIDDAEVLDGLDEAARVEREQEEENHVLQKSSFEVSFHQIKPTGWDDDYVGHDRRYHSLTGMMVGE